MESEADRPTVWEIRNRLLSTLDHLEGYAHHRPNMPVLFLVSHKNYGVSKTN